MNLQGYSIEHTPTESTCGGSLLYINNNVNCVCRNELQIHIKKKLKQLLQRSKNSNGKNIIVRCIHRHPCMNPSDFNDIYLHELLQKLQNNNKQIFLIVTLTLKWQNMTKIRTVLLFGQYVLKVISPLYNSSFQNHILLQNTN